MVLMVPSNHVILVSDSGSFFVFLKVGNRATNPTNMFAKILNNGSLNANQRITPIEQNIREKMSLFEWPPTPFLSEAMNILVVITTAAPNNQRELSAPLAN